MDLLPIELKRKIFYSCSWQERLICLRLVNSEWRELIDFRDVRKLSMPMIRKLSNLKNFSDDQFIFNALSIVGGHLESFGFDSYPRRNFESNTNEYHLRFQQIQEKSMRLSRGRYLEEREMSAIVRSCPLLREIYGINGVGPECEPMLQWSSTLSSLVGVSQTERVRTILSRMRLRTVGIVDLNIDRLFDVADNSLLTTLYCLENGYQELFDSDRIAFIHQLAAKFPNLRSHYDFDCWPVFDSETNTISPVAVEYGKAFPHLRRSWILDLAPHDCNLCIPDLARWFPNLQRLNLRGVRAACLETSVSFPRLTRLKLTVEELPQDDLVAVLSLERLKKLEINGKLSRGEIIVDWPVDGNLACRCVGLKDLRFFNIRLPKAFWSTCLQSCLLLKALIAPRFDAAIELINYATRLGNRCRLQRLETDSFTSANIFQLLAQPFPRLVKLKIGLIDDKFETPKERLIGCRRLKQLEYVGRLCEVLEALINASSRLEELVVGPFINWGHPEMLFNSIGRHPSLEKVRICSGLVYRDRVKTSNGQENRVLESLRFGRLETLDSGFRIRWRELNFPANTVKTQEECEKLAKVHISVYLR